MDNISAEKAVKIEENKKRLELITNYYEQMNELKSKQKISRNSLRRIFPFERILQNE